LGIEARVFGLIVLILGPMFLFSEALGIRRLFFGHHQTATSGRLDLRNWSIGWIQKADGYGGLLRYSGVFRIDCHFTLQMARSFESSVFGLMTLRTCMVSGVDTIPRRSSTPENERISCYGIHIVLASMGIF
jgi:hypothetical protein